MIVGPGNAFVAEAKRQLFGRVGIDLLAGPSEVAVIADETADPELVAADLLAQAEHGPTSPAVLITTSEPLGRAVIDEIARQLDELDRSDHGAPGGPAGETPRRAWTDHGVVMVAADREHAAQLSDEVATEHLEVHTADDDWYLRAPAQLRLAVPRPPRHRRLLRQGDRHQPHAAHRPRRPLHRRPVGRQVPQDADLPADRHRRGRPRRRAARGRDLARRPDARPRGDRHQAPGPCCGRRDPLTESARDRALVCLFSGLMQRRSLLIAGLAIVLLGSIVYLLVLAAGGASLVAVVQHPAGSVLSVHQAWPWLVVALVVAVMALAGWAVTERQRALSSTAGDAERDRLSQELEAERERFRREIAQLRAEREQIIQGWRSEREWNRELRGQIERMHRTYGTLGRHDDVRKMVLELTMSLVDAEKGILLSAEREDDNSLEVVCFLGFDNDPHESALAQRFADGGDRARHAPSARTIEGRVDDESRTAADEEVHNLLAIPIYLSDDFAGVIVCANREDGFESLDDEVLLAVGDHAGAVLQNSRLHGDLRSAYLSTIRVLADAIELKDPELRGHSDAVSEYVLAVADRLDFEPDRREALIFASLLHDVGKLGISERILLKPAQLTPEERNVIELHPRIGYQLVRQVPALQKIAPAVLHHHERFDGDGYPGRLRGEAIPLEARIIAIADTFSAITSDRPYSRALQRGRGVRRA